MAIIDLHTHTTFSDGRLAPLDLVRRAAARGVTVLAVTDHDTVAGLADCARAASTLGVRLVPGLEISTRCEGEEVHLLGHFVDPSSPGLAELSEEGAQARADRMAEMVDRAARAGLPVTLEEVLARAGQGGTVGRPHLARLLVDRGAASSLQDAFDRYLGPGRVAFVPRRLPEPAVAIARVRAAGGCVSVAHPTLRERTLEALAGAGVDALETGHPSLDPGRRRRLEGLCAALGLARTAGSDFHGDDDNEPGSHPLSPAHLEEYEARRRA